MKLLCELLLKAKGWKFETDLPPDLKSFMLIGAPHTSNFDFITAMALVKRIGRNARFVIKNEWMKFPTNLVFGPAGGIGLDRTKLKESHTDSMAQLFKDYPELVLMIAPEGTRSPTSKWKTGFYYIAQKANVPIVLGYADFDKKVLGVGPIIWPRNFEEDMKTIMQFYRDVKGRVPENFLLDPRFLPPK